MMTNNMFSSTQAAVAKMSKARAAVRQWKTLKKPKKLKKAQEKLQKLQEKEVVKTTIFV